MTVSKHTCDNERSASAAQDRAIAHFIQSLNRTQGRDLGWIKAVGRAIGIQSAGTNMDLKHRLIPTTASIVEHSAGSFFSSTLRGAIALIGSYARGEWDSDDLYATLQYLLYADRIVSIVKPLAYLGQAKHNPRRHSQDESSLHYDLPLALFRTITDGRSYSAIRWRYDALSAGTASYYHYKRILELTGLQSGNVVDLGAGWGTFAEYILGHTNLDISCVTLSLQQHEALSEKFAGNCRASVVLADFRVMHELPLNANLVTLFESIEHLSVRDRIVLLGALRRRYPSAWLVIQTTCRNGFAAKMRSGTRGALNEIVFPGPGTPATRHEILSAAKASGFHLAQEQDMTAEYAYSAMTWATRMQQSPLQDIEIPMPIYRAFMFYLNAMAASLAMRRVSSNLFIFSPA